MRLLDASIKYVLISTITIVLSSCQVNARPASVETSQPATAIATPTSWINGQGYLLTRDNSGSLMVHIPPGEFTMGVTLDQLRQLSSLTPEDCSLPDGCPVPDVPDKLRSHQVQLTHAFLMDIYETTNGQYAACVAAGACTKPPPKIMPFPLTLESYDEPQFIQYPVIVLFSQAQDFCRWRSGSLPTEAQWEYAARGKDGRLWPWGNVTDTHEAAMHMNFILTVSPNGYHFFVPVDSFSQGVSPFGLYNMAGNIDEWVLDRLSPYPTNPVVDPLVTSDESLIKRGGHYGNSIDIASTVDRYPADLRTGTAGIRCVESTVP